MGQTSIRQMTPEEVERFELAKKMKIQGDKSELGELPKEPGVEEDSLTWDAVLAFLPLAQRISRGFKAAPKRLPLPPKPKAEVPSLPPARFTEKVLPDFTPVRPQVPYREARLPEQGPVGMSNPLFYAENWTPKQLAQASRRSQDADLGIGPNVRDRIFPGGSVQTDAVNTAKRNARSLAVASNSPTARNRIREDILSTETGRRSPRMAVDDMEFNMGDREAYMNKAYQLEQPSIDRNEIYRRMQNRLDKEPTYGLTRIHTPETVMRAVHNVKEEVGDPIATRSNYRRVGDRVIDRDLRRSIREMGARSSSYEGAANTMYGEQSFGSRAAQIGRELDEKEYQNALQGLQTYADMNTRTFTYNPDKLTGPELFALKEAAAAMDVRLVRAGDEVAPRISSGNMGSITRSDFGRPAPQISYPMDDQALRFPEDTPANYTPKSPTRESFNERFSVSPEQIRQAMEFNKTAREAPDIATPKADAIKGAKTLQDTPLTVTSRPHPQGEVVPEWVPVGGKFKNLWMDRTGRVIEVQEGVVPTSRAHGEPVFGAGFNRSVVGRGNTNATFYENDASKAAFPGLASQVRDRLAEIHGNVMSDYAGRNSPASIASWAKSAKRSPDTYNLAGSAVKFIKKHPTGGNLTGIVDELEAKGVKVNREKLAEWLKKYGGNVGVGALGSEFLQNLYNRPQAE